MKSTDRNLDALTVPADDGRIAESLAQLESLFGQWTDGMRAAHAALRAATSGRDDVNQVLTDSGPAAPDAAESTGAGDRKRLAARLTEAPSLVDADVQPTEEALARFAVNAEPEPDPESIATVDEDEQLLATLNPKVAKEIRIKRRLCGGRKSVRELLDEM